MAIQYALKVFEYENKRPFRIIDRNGEPWFVLGDVCGELEIANSRDAASRLDDDEKDVVTADTLGGAQKMTIINESGLYSLILTSRKPEAKRFKKWVTSEVLPSIRRTGKYGGGGTPAFIRRYNRNWDRVSVGYFSVMNELTVRVWGRFEHLGHIISDKAPDGREIRPDISVGMGFSKWLKKNHPAVCDNYDLYPHWTPAGEFDARQYPEEMLPLYLRYVDTVWIPQNATTYFNSRDPAALPHIGHLLPTGNRPLPALS